MSSSKTIAIFGAGPGWSYGVARKYAQQGYHVVLVSRTASRLAELVTRLKGEVPGAKATTYVSDISINTDLNKTIGTILKANGFVDVVFCAPAPAGFGFVQAANMTVEKTKENFDIYYYPAVAIVQGFLPTMLEKKSGAFIFGGGGSAVQVFPNLSGPGPAQAALRNYTLCLNKELEDKGIHVGLILVTSFILGSEGAKAANSFDDVKLPPGVKVNFVESSELADVVTEVIEKKQAERHVPSTH